jgi:hypothetical protein
VPITNCTPTNPPITDTGTSADCSNFFSVRFTSTQAIAPGLYNFIVSSDDGVRVYINGALVLDRYVGRPLTTDTITQNITTSPTQITVEYFDGIGEAVIQFQWFLQGAATTPGAPGVGTVVAPGTPAAGALTAQVVSVRGLALRSGPYLGASLIGVARPGNAYIPTARNTDEGGAFTWYKITVGTQTGWSSGRYLEFTGDPNGLPLQGTVFEQIDGAPDLGVTAVPRSIMNFRRRPSRRSQLLGQIAWGEELSLLGRTIQGGENFWYQVRYDGQVGWIFAPFVSVRGDLNSVPIH